MIDIKAVMILNKLDSIIKDNNNRSSFRPGSRIYKEHINKFGVEPNIIFRGSLESPKLISGIKQAIDRNIPYDELNELSPEEQVLYEQGGLQT
jgi:hypothetical protein